MSGKSIHIKRYWCYILIIVITLSGRILSQDNTNNMMVERTNTNTDGLNRMMRQNANYYSNDLMTKLDLTKSQEKYIYNILYSYYTNSTENDIYQRAAIRQKPESLNLEQDKLMRDGSNIRVNDNGTNTLRDAQNYPLTKIETILDKGQMDKWIMVKDAWWLNAQNVLSNSNGVMEEEKDSYNGKGEYEDNRDYENYDVYYPGNDIKR